MKIADQAGFGEASYDLLPDLTLTAGARYSFYSISTIQYGALNGTDLFDGPPSTLARSSKNDAFTPKVSLSYRLNQDAMIYVLADRGSAPAIQILPLPRTPSQDWPCHSRTSPMSFGTMRPEPK